MSCLQAGVTNWQLWGREMTEFVWYWTKGNSKIYTRNTEIAEKAMKEGMLVMGTKVRPNIMKYQKKHSNLKAGVKRGLYFLYGRFLDNYCISP